MWKAFRTVLLFLLATASSHATITISTTSSGPGNSSQPTQLYMATNNKEQAYVSGGSMVSFGSQLLAQEKADILDSLLYAELTASDVYDKTSNFGNWYKTYLNVLNETSWQIKMLRFTPYTPPANSYFTILGMVWDFLSPMCRSVQDEVLQRLLDLWKSLSDSDHRVRSFLTSSGTGGTETKAANFQIMPATRGDTGEVILVFGGFYYSSEVPVMRFMKYFWSKPTISLYHSLAVTKFTSNTYSKYRNTIQKELGKRAAALIHQIDI